MRYLSLLLLLFATSAFATEPVKQKRTHSYRYDERIARPATIEYLALAGSMTFGKKVKVLYGLTPTGRLKKSNVDGTVSSGTTLVAGATVRIRF